MPKHCNGWVQQGLYRSTHFVWTGSKGNLMQSTNITLAEDQQQSSHEMCIAFGSSGRASTALILITKQEPKSRDSA